MEKLILFINNKLYRAKPPKILLATVPPLKADLGIPESIAKRVKDIINPEIRGINKKLSIPLVDNYTLLRTTWSILKMAYTRMKKGMN